MPFRANDWYWQVGNDVYASKRNTYVATTDAEFVTWRSVNGDPVKLATEIEIWYYMKEILPAWLWNGETFSQPAVGQYHQFQLQQYSAMKRWRTETGGIVSGSIPVKTDDRSKGMISMAKDAAANDAQFSRQWVGSDGNFYTVNHDQMLQMHVDVSKHAGDCFNTYTNLDAQIKSGTVTTLEKIDETYAGV